jgi:hypothetical protein
MQAPKYETGMKTTCLWHSLTYYLSKIKLALYHLHCHNDFESHNNKIKAYGKLGAGVDQSV